MKTRATAVLLTVAVMLAGLLIISGARTSPWSPQQVETLRSLSLAALPPLAPDPTNHVADDPRAVSLGHALFFDARFSKDGTVSCASCHIPELNFQDARAHGRGIAETRRRTQSIVGTAYLAWFFWDGRKDSQWSQALAPLEHPDEQGGDRAQYLHLLAQNYRSPYTALFGALPERDTVPAHAGPAGDEETRSAWNALPPAQQQALSRVYANMGKAIAAYERQIVPGKSRFDDYVDAVTHNDMERAQQIFSNEETAGLALFIGKAHCVTCHNTPLFSDDQFHNTGVPQHPETEHDLGRAEGAGLNLTDEFKCWSEYSDDPERNCPSLRYMEARSGALRGAFKTPSLRRTLFVPPFMHNAWYTTLDEILDHYNRAPAAVIGETELQPLNLSQAEKDQLKAFLLTLTAPLGTPPNLLTRPDSP